MSNPARETSLHHAHIPPYQFHMSPVHKEIVLPLNATSEHAQSTGTNAPNS